MVTRGKLTKEDLAYTAGLFKQVRKEEVARREKIWKKLNLHKK